MNKQRRLRPWLLSVSAAAALAACGGGGGSGSELLGASPSTALPVKVATFTDAAVSGLEYSSPSTSGITDVNGNFEYVPGETVTFALGQVVLGSTAPSGDVVRPLDLVPGASSDADSRVTRILRTLQSLDSDGDPETDGIHIESGMREHLRSAAPEPIRLDDDRTTDDDVEAVLPTRVFTVDAAQAIAHAEAHADDDSNAHLGYVPPAPLLAPSTLSEVSAGAGGSALVGSTSNSSDTEHDASDHGDGVSSDDYADGSDSHDDSDASSSDHDGVGSDDSSTYSSGSGSTGTTTPVAQPTLTSGRLLASNCFQCHGTGGWGGFDRIRGGEADEVFEYLGEQANRSIMAAHAQGFTRAQLNAIVTYLNQ